MNPFDSTLPNYSQQMPASGGYRGVLPGASASGVSVVTDQERMAKLKALAVRHELSSGAVSKLRSLEAYDIVVIADDSGSMSEKAHTVPKDDPFALVPTRWQELCQRVTDIIEFATALDKDGIDIYFLNRGYHHNITSAEDARKLFIPPPSGRTPLLRTYQQVLRDKLTNDKETKTLILIATDGEPDKKDAFIHCLEKRDSPDRCPTSIMACTDKSEEIKWLNQLDKNTPFLDVQDDYGSELAEVKAAQGELIRFTKGDYNVKHMLGAIDPVYGSLDKRKLDPQELASYYGE